MRGWLLGLGIALAGFALGSSGAPGLLVSSAAAWLESSGRVELGGPTGEAVRQAL